MYQKGKRPKEQAGSCHAFPASMRKHMRWREGANVPIHEVGANGQAHDVGANEVGRNAQTHDQAAEVIRWPARVEFTDVLTSCPPYWST
jgi:hypothetical protein